MYYCLRDMNLNQESLIPLPPSLIMPSFPYDDVFFACLPDYDSEKILTNTIALNCCARYPFNIDIFSIISSYSRKNLKLRFVYVL